MTWLADLNPPADLPFAITSSVSWEALALDRTSFAGGPIPCVDDLAAAAGLEIRGLSVAEAGFDWQRLERWRRRYRLRHLHNLEPADVDWADSMLQLTLDALERRPANMADPADPAAPDPSEVLAEGLWRATVFDAWLSDLRYSQIESEQILMFIEAAHEQVGGVRGAGLAAAAGHYLEELGDIVAAEQRFEEAASHGHPVGAVRAAAYRVDRGDAVGALALLRRVELDPQDPDLELLLEEVATYAVRPPSTVGRNDRCPCGSGKKYKACHLGKEQLPLADRIYWLMAKARRYLHSSEDEVLPTQLLSIIGRSSGRPHEIRAQLANDIFLDDLALHEGGVFANFLEQRGHLLPADEALLAAQWALTDRSVFEILDPDPQQFTLRDVRTRDRLVIGNTGPRATARRGTYLLGRPVPFGDEWRALWGFFPLDASWIDTMLAVLDEGDEFDLADALGRTLATPRMANTDGHDLALQTLRWTVTDPAATPAILQAAGLREDEGRFTLLRDTPNMAQAIIATFRLEGSELEADVNSEQRAAEVTALVAAHLPDAVAGTPTRHSPGDIAGDEDDDGGEDLPSGFIGPDEIAQHPELAAALAEMIRGHEQRWLDEEIPALRGRTPRDAAQDPIGRFELTRLLATFADTDDPTQMSGRRLRAALDLEPF